MIRRVIQWLRVATPPRSTALLLLPVLGFEVIYAYGLWDGWGPALADLLNRRDILFLGVVAAVGAQRAYLFHPLFHQGYRKWLALTPWTGRVALPVGPVHLVPQDGLWLAIALVLWHDPQISRLYLPVVYLLFYLVVLCISCVATGVASVGWLSAFGLGEVLRQWYTPQAALSVEFWLYLIGWIGLRRSLARFPWKLPWYWDMPSMQAVAEEQKQRMLGFPLDQLHGRPGEEQSSLMQRTLLGVWIGWMVYTACSLATIPPMTLTFMGMALTMITIASLGARTFGYWLDYRPPISFWGRFRTMKWVIPRYDHILIPPALIFLVACFMPPVLAGWHLPLELALPITTSLVALMAFNMPPSLERWRLTGFHRIVPGTTNKQEFVKI